MWATGSTAMDLSSAGTGGVPVPCPWMLWLPATAGGPSGTLISRYISTTTATASTTIMLRSSFLPVTWVMDWLRSTFFSSLMPSGVFSKAQANTSASGKPTTSSSSTVFITQSGVPKLSSARSATWATSQAVIT